MGFGVSTRLVAEDFLHGSGEEEGEGGVGVDIRNKDQYGFEQL